MPYIKILIVFTVCRNIPFRCAVAFMLVATLFPSAQVPAKAGGSPAGNAGEDPTERTAVDGPPVYIAFHWHMHQPIYWPYESVVETEARGAYSFSLREVHTSRTGPYTDWPSNAVQRGADAGMVHFGAQVSFSGSLIENLEAARQAGWGFQNWTAPWADAITLQTGLGNPRLAMTGFGYHHPLMPLLDQTDIRRHIQWHRESMGEYFPGEFSKGIFPPETAFSTRMIPAMVEEGFEWVIVDNLHFERAAQGAPYADQSAVKRPNRSDVRNPNPGDWNQLDGLWAPTPVSMQWAHQPRYVSFTDPETGEISKMIAVPASRYLGEEDGRGGFGALQYEHVMSQFEAYNTDPDQPILLLLHHDGDNHGGGSSAYYNHNFENMVNWLQEHPDRFVVTTIQDYLDKYPPDPDDVIHVQDGSWLGADGGDPEFLKWLSVPREFPGADSLYSPNRNAWGILTAAKNYVETAEQIDAGHTDTRQAWRYYLNGQSSDYWYWDGTEMWDSHPARAANLAIARAKAVAEGGADETGPSIFLPQRTPYNPGGIEWDGQGVMPSDFEVWTYVYDMSGVDEVVLRYRVSASMEITEDNLTYAGGPAAGDWQSVPMTGTYIPSVTNPLPDVKAEEFRTEIAGLEEMMVDYYVEATDSLGNVSRSIIQHVWVGSSPSGSDPGNGGPDPDGPVTWEPPEPTIEDTITITVTDAHTTGNLHWGVNNWTRPHEDFWPEGSFAWEDQVAVQTPMTQQEDGSLSLQLGPFAHEEQEVTNISFVISYSDDSWDNNSGNDYLITISQDVSAGNRSGNGRSEDGRSEDGSADEDTSDFPAQFTLMSNYPNPFNTEAVIPFSLDRHGPVRLAVYDLLGRRVALLVDGTLEAGSHRVRFDASDLAGGMYVYRLESAGRVLTGRMTLVK
ncbi:MAG: T9SS type A sorting domain-containing protein [Bacteroidota bacterium]